MTKKELAKEIKTTADKLITIIRGLADNTDNGFTQEFLLEALYDIEFLSEGLYDLHNVKTIKDLDTLKKKLQSGFVYNNLNL